MQIIAEIYFKEVFYMTNAQNNVLNFSYLEMARMNKFEKI